MIRPLLFIVGYHILSISAESGARWANLCAAAKIPYHPTGVFTDESGSARMSFRLTPLGSLRIRALCLRAGVEVRVEERHGLPVLARRILHRPGLIVGAAACVWLTMASGAVIWDVRVEGNRTVDADSITDTLRECGVGVGMSSKGLDMGEVENRFLVLQDGVSWISVNVRGTVAQVEVREHVSAEEQGDVVASNLVAARNGRVLEFDRVRGNIEVVIGEDVSEGQLLVGGICGSESSPMRFVRASGRVMALCEREYTVSVPLTFEKKVYTGRQKSQKSIIFFDKEIKLFSNSRNWEGSCDIIEREEYINLFGLGELPFGIRTRTYAYYELQECTRTEQQASEQANYELWQRFWQDAPDAQTVGKHLYAESGEGKYILHARIESIENIAKEVEIKIDLLE